MHYKLFGVGVVRDSLLLQRRELQKKLKEHYVEREVGLKQLESNVIKVIMGPRRAGKSFFALHALNNQGSFGYANFDDEKLVETKDYNEIVNTLNSFYKNPRLFLFDEIQNLEKWELFVNRLQRQGYNIVITGSNSKLLSREMATHLTGRHTKIILFPFSFKEFLGIEKQELTQSEIKTKLDEYLEVGGYPEPIIKKLDHKDYLTTLFNAILYQDIVKRFKIRKVQAIENLASYLISNIAKEFSYTALSKLTKCKSPHTVEKYLNYLEEAFIFFKLNRFSFKVKEQLTSNKKIYCIDNGLINANAFKVSPDYGRLYENTVAIALKKQEMNQSINLYYWKNPQQEEVDFVIKKGTKIKELIQVCYNIEEPKTKERETRALLKASVELKCKNLTIITKGKQAEKKETWFGTKRKIKYTPLWKWLLEY